MVKSQEIPVSVAKSLASSVLNRYRIATFQAHSEALSEMEPAQINSSKAKKSSSSDLTLAYTAKDGDKVLFYIFNDVKNNSFAIIGGDESAQKVLGYCTSGIYNADSVPDALNWLLKQYSAQISEGINAQSKTLRKISEKQDIQPLILTTWDQGYPYNAAIPTTSDGKRYYTGCVATAMSQVMNYYKWPERGSSRLEFQTAGQKFSADFESTTYDWSNMLDSYTGKYSDVEKDAIATLMYHAGVSVNMCYGLSGSGAYDIQIPKAFINNFNYDKSVTYLSRPDFSDDDWEDRIYAEFQQGRPVIYNGTNSNNSERHCFICDGYSSSDNLFHINWGWSGSHDGYYALDGSAILTGTTFNYSTSHVAITDIKPTTNEDAVPMILSHNAQFYIKPVGAKIKTKYKVYNLEKNQQELPTIEYRVKLRNTRLVKQNYQLGIMLVDTITKESTIIPDEQIVSPVLGTTTSVTISMDISSLISKDAVYKVCPVIRNSDVTNDKDWFAPIASYRDSIPYPILAIGSPTINKEVEEDSSHVADHTIKTDTLSISVDRELGQGRIITKVPYDENAVNQLLNIDQILPEMIYEVKATTGELLSDWSQYDGWVDAKGNPTTDWDDEGTIMSVKYPHNGYMVLYTNPVSEPTEPSAYKAQWAIIKDTCKVILDVTVNFVKPRDTPEPTDGINYTKYIVNPDFTGNDVETGWTEGDTWGAWGPDENAEMYRPYYNTYQTIKGLPKGKYLVEVDAFYRDGMPKNEEKTYFHSDTLAVSAMLYVNSAKGFFEVPICRAASAASKVRLAENESALTNSEGETVYIPNDMKSAALYFNKGLYKNGIWTEVGDDGQLKIGMRYESNGGYYFDWWADGRWTIVDNWKLTYFSNDSAHVCGDNQYTKTTDIDFKQYIANQPIATDDNPVDCTSFLVNPAYDHDDVTTSWLGGPAFTPFPGSEIASMPRGHNTTQDNFQHISGLPAGIYRIDVDGFYSYGDHIWEYYGYIREWYDNGVSGVVTAANSSLGRLYSVTSKGKVDVPLCRMFWGRSAQSLGGQEITDDSLLTVLHENPWLTTLQDDRPGLDYFPDDAKSASIYMQQGRYPNSMYVEVGDDGDLLLGVNDSIGFPIEWLVVDNWKLYYCGMTSKHTHGEDGCALQKYFLDYDSYAAYLKTVDTAAAEIYKNNGKQTDVSSVIRCAGFDENTAWLGLPTINYSCAEKWYCDFDVNEMILTPRTGYYKLACQGFYRYNNLQWNDALVNHGNTNSIAVETHNNGTELLLAKLYAGNDSVPLMSIAEEMDNIAAKKLTASESGLPYSMEEARLAFDAGLYDKNAIVFYADAGEQVKIGVCKNTTLGADWTVLDNFRLTYLGEKDSTKVYGDVTGDGKVDISDVNVIISVICNTIPTSDGRGEASDVNGNGKVDISDVNAVIAVICAE